MTRNLPFVFFSIYELSDLVEENRQLSQKRWKDGGARPADPLREYACRFHLVASSSSQNTFFFQSFRFCREGFATAHEATPL